MLRQMNKKKVRNGIFIAVAASFALLGAPRFVHRSLNLSTAELAPSLAIDHAVERVSANIRSSHLGFDTNIYPGDRAMDAWKAAGDYEWVGYYLQGACHKDASWSGTRSRLTLQGWGLAVLYVGQQTWGRQLSDVRSTTPSAPRTARQSRGKRSAKRRSVGTMTRKTTKPVASSNPDCSASFVNAARGSLDARDAITKTRREGFATGSVVFLDVEYMDAMPQPIRDYYRAWTRAMLADGQYRPGIYAHTRNAAVIYDDVSEVYAQSGVRGDPPFWIAGSNGFAPGRQPTHVGHAFASAWQGVLDVVRTVNGIKLPIDISVASMNSPSQAVQ